MAARSVDARPWEGLAIANVISSNPFILDTAADDIVAPGKPLFPKKAVWVRGTTAGHICLIEDGREVAKAELTLNVTAAGGFVQFDFPSGFKMDGLSLGTLSSGVLYLYF